jgi:hypothetical protein
MLHNGKEKKGTQKNSISKTKTYFIQNPRQDLKIKQKQIYVK